MSDEDVATRAPESDAAEDHKAVLDKVDQGSASLGEHCTTDRPTPNGASPTGEIVDYNGVEAYISKPSDYPHSPSKLLLLLTGGTGIHSTNNQLQADHYAAEGFLVVMPDQFAGDPVSKATTTTTPISPAGADKESYIEQFKLGIAAVAKSFSIDMWLARHTPETVLPILDKVITALKDDYADAVANGGGLYAVGYCFGAKYVCLLGATLGKDAVAGQRDTESDAERGMVKQGPQIKCGAIAHGTVITQQDLAGIEVPLTIVAVKDDSLFPDDVRDAGIKAIRDKGGEVEEKVYDGVPHGFAVLGDYEEASIKEQQAQAFDQMLHFLKSH